MSDRPPLWLPVAAAQDGLLTRRQLRRLGLSSDYVDTQLDARRWQEVSSTVLGTTTGVLTRRQLMWAGVLHAGERSALGGLTALERHGLERWHRDEITVLVEKSHNLEPIKGIHFVETRRPIPLLTASTALPTWQVEPAALLWAGYEPVTRSAYGLLSACVQQGLTTAIRLDSWITRMRPLRRAKPFRRLLGELAEGTQSAAERDVLTMCDTFRLPRPDRQKRRRDSGGRFRYTDAEWTLADGRVVVLEVDGGFHMHVEHWSADIERERQLIATGLIVIRCSAIELREHPERIVRDLRRLGVVESSA
ncbi:hypothetical protein KM427_17290 [Nocardioides sp. LMS-CY]|uniref:hypothetical protein n=1 Tax=Nocardioides sp. (strain LMS-CY) TaxID=2840457 RepID=UPI001C005CF6|nr:hypothetical protein [Nocardioides sp. LMS-CY]QWF20715.1 hypothetical protein KM427_17290 [Nocardioides sp. LMS-CY]